MSDVAARDAIQRQKGLPGIGPVDTWEYLLLPKPEQESNQLDVMNEGIDRLVLIRYKFCRRRVSTFVLVRLIQCNYDVTTLK